MVGDGLELVVAAVVAADCCDNRCPQVSTKKNFVSLENLASNNLHCLVSQVQSQDLCGLLSPGSPCSFETHAVDHSLKR